MIRAVVKRRGDPAKALAALKATAALATIVGDDLYGDFEAKRGSVSEHAIRKPGRFWQRPLHLTVLIWTEDTDFFGCGVATWTSGSIDIFLLQ